MELGAEALTQLSTGSPSPSPVLQPTDRSQLSPNPSRGVFNGRNPAMLAQRLSIDLQNLELCPEALPRNVLGGHHINCTANKESCSSCLLVCRDRHLTLKNMKV